LKKNNVVLLSFLSLSLFYKKEQRKKRKEREKILIGKH